MGVHASYGSLIFGSIGAAVIGVILELFFFSVDYSRSENLQYEDDEYYEEDGEYNDADYQDDTEYSEEN